ncbi:Syg1p [Sporobolomyces koalae]|uniref:Syg1p n=1 Tax=Sporobolomyces koalae TaxID=500713 RepID=UPI003170F2D0
MKFARYLASHRIDEWRNGYIDYRQLKKQIGRAEDELLELERNEKPGELPREIQQQPKRRETVDSAASNASPRHAVEDYLAHEADLERGAGAEDSDDADDERVKLPDVLSKSPDSYVQSPLSQPGNDVEVNEEDDDHYGSIGARPPTLRRTSGLSTSSREHSDVTTKTANGLIAKPPNSRKSSKARLTRSAGDHFKPNLESARAADERPTLRKWRFELSHKNSLEEIMDRIPTQSQRFFKMTDKELAKVEAFWDDRMEQALKRFDELGQQWTELATHRKEYHASHNVELHAPKALKSVLPKHAHAIPGSGLVRRTFARASSPASLPSGIDGEQARSDGSEDSRKSARNNPASKPLAALQHGRPEEYTQARSKLKLATFEFYRYLGMLKSYRVLNRTGFAKAAKKFEKVTSIPCALQYKPKIENSRFVSSSDLDDLIRKTEDAFASVFEHGNRKKALERLRDFGKKRNHHFAAWRAGMLMGSALPLMIQGLVISWQPRTRAEIPYWAALLQLFGACYLPIFFTLAFFINLATWNHGRINYVLIFELDVRNKLDYHQFLEIPALFFFILSLFFWAAFSNFWPDHISPSSYPLAWLVIVLVLLLCPLNLFYASARWWMARSMARVFSSGIVAVRFRDFFLGDELNSIYYSIYNLGFLYCTYSKGWPDNAQSICSTNKTWTSAVLASLPPFFRLGQSIRRYIDSDGLTLHLMNAGKYSATITYFWFYFNWRIDFTRHETSDPWRFALFIVFATINSLYVATWDILLDWSLGKRNPKHPYLRAELGFFKDNWWLYYVFAVVNFILRFSWVLYLAPHPSPAVQSYIIALVEASRRIMWNTFRVEAEHIGNRDGYRVTRDVSLPYVTASSPEAGGQLALGDDEDDPALPIQKRIFNSLHRLHRSIVQNLEPVIDGIVTHTGWRRKIWPRNKRAGKGSNDDDDDDDDGVEDNEMGDRGSIPGGSDSAPNRQRSRQPSDAVTTTIQKKGATDLKTRRKKRRNLEDGGDSPSSSEAEDSTHDIALDSTEGARKPETEKFDENQLTGQNTRRRLDSDDEEDEVEAEAELRSQDAHTATADEAMKEEMRDAERMRNASMHD